MLRCLICVSVLMIGPVCAVQTNDKKTWQEGELKKLEGRWTTVREEKSDQGEIRRRRVDVEYVGGNLKVFIFDKKAAPPWEESLKVSGVEQSGSRGLASRLNLERQEEIYYDFVGENLILVGGIGHRPFEGFKLSGEYKRAEKPK